VRSVALRLKRDVHNRLDMVSHLVLRDGQCNRRAEGVQCTTHLTGSERLRCNRQRKSTSGCAGNPVCHDVTSLAMSQEASYEESYGLRTLHKDRWIKKIRYKKVFNPHAGNAPNPNAKSHFTKSSSSEFNCALTPIVLDVF
jgi:hypothetical protein